MTKYLVEECGEFRHGEEGVFNGDECIFMAPPAQFVPQLMDELFEWMKKSRNSVHPLIMSSVFHYEFVFIHPFADGNGRMARLWHTAILAKWKPVFEFIPIESRIEKFQDEYFDAIISFLFYCQMSCFRRIYHFYRVYVVTDRQDSGRYFASDE